METKPLKHYKIIGNIISSLSLLILAIGGYWFWHSYKEDGATLWVGVLLIAFYFIVNIFYWNTYRVSRVRCPVCKSKLFPLYEGMDNNKETWVQIKFPCKKCNIVWDTEERINVNEKDNPLSQSKGAV